MIDCQRCEWWDDQTGCPFCDGCEFQELPELPELPEPPDPPGLPGDCVLIFGQ